jgi:uncharacterized protein YjiS (DUF1127 family)
MLMPAATESAGFLGRAGALARRFVAMMRAFKSRHDLQRLTEFDDRMLADIGLTRGDLRDAVAQPLWHDPTAVLVIRACERRQAARGSRGHSCQVVAAPFAREPRAAAYGSNASSAVLPY